MTIYESRPTRQIASLLSTAFAFVSRRAIFTKFHRPRHEHGIAKEHQRQRIFIASTDRIDQIAVLPQQGVRLQHIPRIR